MGTFTEVIQFSVQHCAECGIAFGITSDFQRRRSEDGLTFRCPNGHALSWHETEIQKLRNALTAKTAELDRVSAARRDAEAARELAEKRLNRVQNGVCPKCKRSFENLRRHMETRHNRRCAKRGGAK